MKNTKLLCEWFELKIKFGKPFLIYTLEDYHTNLWREWPVNRTCNVSVNENIANAKKLEEKNFDTKI